MGQKRWLGLGAVLVVGIAIALWSLMQQRTGASNGEPRGGDIALASTQGNFSLAQLEEDQLAVLFFGYTYCPDVCPMTLAVVRQAMQRMESELTERVVPLLVTVDPARDSLERLEEYVGFFGESFIGLRGSEAQLEDVTERYGVFWRKVDMQDSAMEYTVDHSSSMYLVDRHGTIRQRVLYSPTPHALITALEHELEAG